ncbi:MAG: sugar transferase [Bacteroidetes bacterium]|nr:sugar transferase [Bacteroidota bacterium]
MNGHKMPNGTARHHDSSYNPGIQTDAFVNSYLLSRQKRAFDIMLSLAMLPFAIPAGIVCWMLVSLTMGFPVIFAQHRVGLNGKVFVMYKFRSIRRTSDTSNGTKHHHNDITPVGRILRMFRLDELPQIYNILRGEMSWVGPRPEIPHYVEIFSGKHPDFNARHNALPGITGLAQVRNPNATPNDNLEKLVHDLEYIRKANLLTDLKILISTALVVINK